METPDRVYANFLQRYDFKLMKIYIMKVYTFNLKVWNKVCNSEGGQTHPAGGKPLV